MSCPGGMVYLLYLAGFQLVIAVIAVSLEKIVLRSRRFWLASDGIVDVKSRGA